MKKGFPEELMMQKFVGVLVNCCSITKSCPTHDPMECSISGLPVLHHLLEFAQTRVHWVSDAIQPSSPSPPALNLSQTQNLFQWVGSWHQVAKVLESRDLRTDQWILIDGGTDNIARNSFDSGVGKKTWLEWI